MKKYNNDNNNNNINDDSDGRDEDDEDDDKLMKIMMTEFSGNVNHYFLLQVSKFYRQKMYPTKSQCCAESVYLCVYNVFRTPQQPLFRQCSQVLNCDALCWYTQEAECSSRETSLVRQLANG